MKDKKQLNNKRVREVVSSFIDGDSFQSDPNGAYTGKAENKYEVPVQDADDL